MQYENNLANGFQDIIRKQNTNAQTHSRTVKHGHDNIPRPTSWAGNKNQFNTSNLP